MKKNWYDVWQVSGFNQCLSRGVEATSIQDAIRQVTGEDITKTTQQHNRRDLYAGESGKKYLANKLPRHPSDMFIGV